MILGYRRVAEDLECKSGFVSAAAFFRHLSALRARDVVHLDEYDAGNPRHTAIVLLLGAEGCGAATALLARFGYPYGLAAATRETTSAALSNEAAAGGDICHVDQVTTNSGLLLRSSTCGPCWTVRLMGEADSLFKGTVAAIVTNHNYGPLLREAVDSIDAQLVPPDELLIVDDGSTDTSASVLDELEAAGKRVIRHPRNLGIIDNFRFCVEQTGSDYVFFLGADNRLRSDFILETRLALDAQSEADVAYTDVLLFGPLAGELARKVGAECVGHAPASNWDVYEWRFPDPTDDVLRAFGERNFVHGSSMYRRSAYDRVGGYRKAGQAEDHNLFHRIWQTGGSLHHVPKPLLEYRQHSTAQANNFSSLTIENAGLRVQLREVKERFSVLEAAYIAQAAEIERLNAAFGKQISELARVQDAFAAQCAEVERVNNAFEQQAAELDRTGAVVVERSAELLRVAAASDAQSAEIARLQAFLNGQAAEIQRLYIERADFAQYVLAEFDAWQAGMLRYATLPFRARIDRLRRLVEAISCDQSALSEAGREGARAPGRPSEPA